MEMKELKPIVQLEVHHDDRIYRFHMPYGAPIGESYDVAFMILKKITDMAQDATKSAAPLTEASNTEEK